MARQTGLTQKTKRGPKPTGKGQLVGVRLQPVDLTALDAYTASTDAPQTRPQAIRTILADWLATHGFLKRHDHPEPAGPATEVVKAMDAAIGKDLRKATMRKR